MEITLEVAVHLGALKNIDLFQRGLYRVVFTLLRDPSNIGNDSSGSSSASTNANNRRLSSSVLGKSFLFTNASSSGQISLPMHDRPVQDSMFHKSTAVHDYPRFLSDSRIALVNPLPDDFPPRPSIVDGDCIDGSLDLHQPGAITCRRLNEQCSIPCYQSRLCLIRYLDEVVVLNEGAVFRMVVNSMDAALNQVLIVSIRLEYADFTGDKNKFEKSSSSIEFSEIAYREIRINSSGLGVHEFVPVILSRLETGFSYLQLMVHSSILSIKFAKSDLESCKYMFQAFVQQNILSAEDDSSSDEDEFYTKKSLEQSKAVQWAERIHSMLVDPVLTSHESTRMCSQDIFNSDSSVALGGTSFLVKPILKKNETKKIAAMTPMEFTKHIETEFEEISFQCYDGWYKLLGKIQNYAPFLEQCLQQRWIVRARDRIGVNILRERHTYEALFHVRDLDAVRTLHSSTASVIRKSISHVEDSGNIMPLEDTTLYIDPLRMPVIFEDRYYEDESMVEASASTKDAIEKVKRDDSRGTPSPSARRERFKNKLRHSTASPPIMRTNKIDMARKHVIVFVFGFMGNRHDMRLFRNLLKMLEPLSVCLLSTANEEITAHADIRVMGENLANEIMNFIESKSDVGGMRCVESVSFVVHSLGGIIVRHALTTPILEPILPRLRTFFTLSSPHLGSKAMDNAIVSAGYSVLRAVKRSRSLEQLTMCDCENGNLRETLLYKLSKSPQIGMFEDVVLLSGHQDQYVPYWSARLELPPQFAQKNSASAAAISEEVLVIAEMQKHIVSSIKAGNARVTKLDISFDFSKQGSNARSMMDRMIGRAAHVQMLDSPAVLFALILTYSDQFFSCTSSLNRQSIWDT